MVTRYLTFSDGSEIGEDKPEYCISYDSISDRFNDDDEVWVVEELLGTGDRDRALEIVRSRGYDTEKISGGYYGDERDDSYKLIPKGE